MPIHLPPLSRRDFLVRSLLAGAGLATSRALFAADRLKPIDPHSFALLSDTHISADPKGALRNVVMADNLRAVTAEVNLLAQRPAHALVNGDCALLRGEPGDYVTFVDGVKPLREAGMPLHLTLGNHDDREHFWSGITEAGGAKRPMKDRHVSMVATPRANWFLLDSLDKVNFTPGLLGENQLAWLTDSLEKNADKPAIIVGHHNPAEADHKGGLTDSDALFAVLAPRRQVKAFIFGHTHDWRVMKHDSGIHLINLPPVAYVFNASRPNGWVHAEVLEHGLRLKLSALDKAHAEHGQVKELEWRA
ncbi:MAG: metallophosphoesterase [Verrucomicrobia bacterium]|nr:metallophosphoesterase [Verrucomicrobiota bacterium]